ncbi:MAG: alpha/beta hydrolase [Ornithinimicrobium sp.]
MSRVSVTDEGSQIELEVSDSGGSGRPVVLIHGWPLSHEAWADQTPALTTAGYRVVSYDRRGFGGSDKPEGGYDYDTLSDDLAGVLDSLDLSDVTLVGFSMGGGEVGRYVARHGQDRLHSVVFASAVPPFMLHTDDNPEGPLEREAAEEMKQGVREGGAEFYEGFTTNFFTAGEELQVSQDQLASARRLCGQADETAAVECIEAFAATDFRDDLTHLTVPTLVLHGSADGIVPFESSGMRTSEIVEGARVHVIDGGPHGVNVSHPSEFNLALLSFLED